MVNLLGLLSPGSPRCFVGQQEELQLAALDALASVAPALLHDYMSCQGNTYLLLLLDWCLDKGRLQKPSLLPLNARTMFLTLVSNLLFSWFQMAEVAGGPGCSVASEFCAL